jgi:hypothetical protein
VRRVVSALAQLRTFADALSSKHGRFTHRAEAVIEWVEDRFGRFASWIVGIMAVLALTVGAVVVAFAALIYLSR